MSLWDFGWVKDDQFISLQPLLIPRRNNSSHKMFWRWYSVPANYIQLNHRWYAARWVAPSSAMEERRVVLTQELWPKKESKKKGTAGKWRWSPWMILLRSQLYESTVYNPGLFICLSWGIWFVILWKMEKAMKLKISKFIAFSVGFQRITNHIPFNSWSFCYDHHNFI